MRIPKRPFVMLFLILASVSGCDESEKNQPPQKKTQTEGAAKQSQTKVGEASWYGPDFQGKETASGEGFNQNKIDLIGNWYNHMLLILNDN